MPPECVQDENKANTGRYLYVENTRNSLISPRRPILERDLKRTNGEPYVQKYQCYVGKQHVPYVWTDFGRPNRMSALRSFHRKVNHVLFWE